MQLYSNTKSDQTIVHRICTYEMYVQFKNCTQKIKSHVNNMAEIALGNNPALLSFM